MQSTVQHTAALVLSLVLVLACWVDVRERRVPNALTAGLAVSGLIYAAVVPDAVGGVTASLTSMLVGLALWLPFYALRMLGAGDVKLFAGAAAWLPLAAVLNAALLAALLGGALSLFWMLRQQGAALTVARLGQVMRQPTQIAALRVPVSAMPRAAKLPYAVPMAAGLLAALWYPAAFFWTR